MITKNRKELRRIFRISEQTIDNYTEQGTFKKLSRGKYDYDACVSGYVDMKNSRNDKPETLKDKELKKLDLDIEKKEMENEQRRGNLIDKQERDREFYELARLTRDTILNTIPRMVPELAHETNEKKTALILETELKKALKTLSEKLIK